LTFPNTGYLYSEGLVSSPDGHVRPFDEKAGGTLFGDGIGAVVLKRLDDALKDGDRIMAVVRGAAVTNDGRDKAGYSAPASAAASSASAASSGGRRHRVRHPQDHDLPLLPV
jgi:acyl transferase domain-containing protein